MKAWLKFYGPFILVLFLLAGWVILFSYISPTRVVTAIGLENSYLIIFALGVICGFSSLTGATFYVAVAALASAGANPLLVGLVGGLGLCISDFAFYFVVSKGTHVIDKHWQRFSDFIKRRLAMASEPFVYMVVFIYSAFFPIPNDIMLVTLAVGGTKFKKIAPYLFLGDIISVILLAYIAH